MSNEHDPVEEVEVVEPPVPDSTPSGSIAVYASEGNFISAQRMAKSLASSTLVPKSYQNNIANVLIAMELSGRIGASVLMVMQNLHVIQGNPGWRSSFLIACLNQSRRFTPLRFEWQGDQGEDDWGCRAIAQDTENNVECRGSLVTIHLAKSEGWYNRNGSKWKTMPEQMLMYRAAAFFSRVYAPELSLGLHTAEEIVDMAPTQSAGAVEMNAALEVAAETAEEIPVDEPHPEESTTPETGGHVVDGQLPWDVDPVENEEDM